MHSRGSLLLTLLRSLESQCRSNAHFLPFGRKKKEEGRRIRCGWWSESISGASYELFALNFHLTLNLPFASSLSLSLFGTGRIRRPPPLIQSVSARTDHDRTMTCRLPLPPILIDFLIASFWQEFAGGYFPNFNLIKMLLSLCINWQIQRALTGGKTWDGLPEIFRNHLIIHQPPKFGLQTLESGRSASTSF